MKRISALALALVVFCICGCASTQTSAVQTQERKLAEFRRDVRDYERLQKQQSDSELASEGDKRTDESFGEPGQAQFVLPR